MDGLVFDGLSTLSWNFDTDSSPSAKYAKYGQNERHRGGGRGFQGSRFIVRYGKGKEKEIQ